MIETTAQMKRILIIDDNQSINKMISNYLDLKEIEHTNATDGKSGLELIRQKKFDIILLDLTMPKFTGYDVLDSLEQEEKLKKENIFVFTAVPLSQSEKDDLVKRGVKSCIKKPIRMKEIFSIIGLNDE